MPISGYSPSGKTDPQVSNSARKVSPAAVVQRQDRGVLQLRRQLDLAQESIGAEGGREVGAQHLDRHLPVVLEVLREIHRPHAAASQLPLQAVAVAKGFGEPGRDVAHDYRNPIRATS
jgi:hypothetical protein